jgi:putative chitinase
MGNTASGDGFAYRGRGRGLMQLTGKESYRDRTRDLRKLFPDAPDFVQEPDEVISEKRCFAVAGTKNSNLINKTPGHDEIAKLFGLGK